eukprot:GHVR01115632.1.p1 GENE.GHVR01115632.1~~GHVR01115632.1.p1  ORF type:complete len:253 (+),score=34.20 GHVR01115632.1:347-1105(+)
MKKLAWLLVLVLLVSCSLSNPISAQDGITLPTDLLLPDFQGDIIYHNYYVLKYDEQHEQAKWVYYILTKDMVLNHSVSRTNDFRMDQSVESISAELIDYVGSGYDRGHLCPAGDMDFDSLAMSESFYMSNMSPQAPSFNRGIWKRLESQVRKWAIENEKIHVITGGVLITGLPVIGLNQVSIPFAYYKIILDNNPPELKAIAFLMENKGSSEPLETFALTVDNIEQLTGINFFENLNNELLEGMIELNKWFK